MKQLLIAIMAAATLPLLGTGCATPAYSGGAPTIKFPEEKATGENANAIIRGWYLDSREIADDTNSALMLGTPSRLTKWNVR